MPSPSSLFAYGTLLFDEVLAAVLGRALPSAIGRIDGFARFAVAGECYPGIVPAAGAAVEGRVYGGLAPADVAQLDAFEGPFYERTPVTVVRQDGARVDAFTYVVRDHRRRALSNEPWDPAAFERRDLARFLRSQRPGIR